MSDQNETGGEIVAYQPAPVARRDMRNPVTDSWTEVVRATSILAEQICQTEFVPQGLRGSAPKVTAAMLYGRELGLAPMGALGAVHVINGKAGLYAETMRGLILQAGHQIRVHESTSTRCVLQARRAGDDEWSTFSYTMAEAQTAGDAKKNANYQSRPADMLLARCTTRMARAIFADVIHGLRSVEEIEDMGPDTDARTGEVQVQQPAPRTVRREQPRAVEAAPAQPAAERPSEPPAAEQEPSRTVSRQTRREQPRGRTERPSGPGEGEAPPAGAPGEGNPSGEGSRPADDQRAAQAEPSPDEETRSRGPKITAAQRTQIQMHMKRLGVEDRDERLYWTGVAAGRGDDAVGSSNELTHDEASDAIDRLGRLRDRDALEAMGAALAGDDDA